MTDWTASRRQALQALGVTTAGLLGIPAVSGQNETEVTVTVEPLDTTVLSGDTVTLDVVVLGASNGIDAYEFVLALDDPSVATVIDFEEPAGLNGSEIIDDGAGVQFETALLDESYDGPDVAIATVTLSGESGGDNSGTTAIQAENIDITDNNTDAYQTAAAPGSLTVEPDERELSAAFDLGSAEPQAGESVTVDASASTGDIVSYNWTFGDGTAESTDDAILEHTYEESGEYEITLELEDSNGNTDQTSQQVTVVGSADSVTAAFEWSPESPVAGSSLTFDATASTGDIVAYRWDLSGDGSFDGSSDDPELVNIYDQPGEYEVTLEVEGESGDTDQTTQTVSVTESDTPLVANFEWEPAEPQVGEEVTFDASESTGNVIEYRWDFTGDGSFEQIVDDVTATFTYDQPGTQTVVLDVLGGSGGANSTTSSVTVAESDDGSGDNGSGDDGSGDDGSGDDGSGDDGSGDDGSGDDGSGDDGSGDDGSDDDGSGDDGSGDDGSGDDGSGDDGSDDDGSDDDGSDDDGSGDDGSGDDGSGDDGSGDDGSGDDGSGNGGSGDDGSGDDGSGDDGSGNGGSGDGGSGDDGSSDGGSGDDGSGDGGSGDDGSGDGGSGDDGSGDGSDGGSDDGSDDGSDGGSGNESSDGSGPGFGPVSALSGLGGAAYLLKQRLLNGGDREE